MNFIKKLNYKKIISKKKINKIIQKKKFIIKDKYNSIIPLKIYQTWCNKQLPYHMKQNINLLKKINPEFEHFLFDDNDCQKFIKKYFRPDVLDAYDRLIPGAYKADLWRYCILYIYGGVYLDIKFNCVNGFKLIALTEKERFPTDVIISEYPDEPNKAVYNGFMMSLPGNIKLLNAINQIVINLNCKYYGNSPLDPTGPIMFGKFFTYKEKKESIIRRYVGVQGNGISIQNIIILDEYDKYRNEQQKIQTHYSLYWNQRNIYNDYIYSNNIYMMDDILFVTAFKNIGRSNWITHTRTNQDYYNYFLLLSQNIKYKLIVYLEDDIKNELLEKYSFNDNIIFCNMNDVDTFYDRYLNEEERIINDKQFQNKVPKNRLKKHPETWCEKYTLINHSKINFVKHARDTYPNYLFYSWIDFGYVRDVNNVPKNLSLTKLSNKIIYQGLSNIPKIRKNAIEMLKIDQTFIAGSSFIIHNSLIDIFERLYQNKIELWHSNYICDDDQSLVLQLYYENKNLFNIVFDPNWFSLYKNLI